MSGLARRWTRAQMGVRKLRWYLGGVLRIECVMSAASVGLMG